MTITNTSFEELLKALSALRPSEEDDEGRTVFQYDKNPVYMVAGEMEDIHWMDIYIGINGLNAHRLEWIRLCSS